MNSITLQPIPYQGSKRGLAKQILSHAPSKIQRLIEPFAGSAAVTLYAAYYKRAEQFLINDSYPPLMNLWNKIIYSPESVAQEYEKIWTKQLEDSYEYYFKIRDEFNQDDDPNKLLYLLARCVKNAPRFNSKGEFNQSPDKRRRGKIPSLMRKQILATSLLLRGKIQLMQTDYFDVLKLATSNDLVYMDPPYQGTSNGKNPRYHKGTSLLELVNSLRELNRRKIPFLLSFDGKRGENIYGKPLPRDLRLYKVEVVAGRSTQATLNGKNEITIESLYVSPYVVLEGTPLLKSNFIY